MRTAKVPTLDDPKLLDKALSGVQGGLVSRLSWLDRAFGKAEVHSVVVGQGVETFPAVYVGKQEYLKVFPDAHIGNFSFFDIIDGQEIDHRSRANVDFEVRFGLVVWFDFRKVYPVGWQHRTTENVKAEVIDALMNIVLPEATIRLSRYWERAENVYRGYTNKQIEEQYLMRPYGGFRIEGVITFRSKPNC